MKRSRSLLKETRGAIFVEHLIAYLPVMFFFLATWQLIELCAAHLIVKRAASAAARAAVVVWPDDPGFYTTQDKKADIDLAAAMILSTSPHFSTDFTVDAPAASGSGPLTATVRARFHCFASWVSLVCGPSGSRVLTGTATYAYQGAPYDYDI